MTRLVLDHLYRETLHWESSVAFWDRLGFRFAEQWGTAPHRAGRLVLGRTEIVLAEVDLDGDPVATPFLAAADLGDLARLADATIEHTHWGTTMITITDPDGRTYHIEQGRPA